MNRFIKQGTFSFVLYYVSKMKWRRETLKTLGVWDNATATGRRLLSYL